MTPSSLAGIVTAITSMVTAAMVLVTAVVALVRSRKVEQKVDVVHKIVNQQRTDMQRYERALVAALKKAGVEVPADQSIETETT